MVPSAENWKAIMTAMTCLCASKNNGIDNNFIADLTNELNYQYPNQVSLISVFYEEGILKWATKAWNFNIHIVMPTSVAFILRKFFFPKTLHLYKTLQTRVFITPEELQEIETKVSYLEKSFKELHSQQIKLLAEIKKIKTPPFCPKPKTSNPSQYIIRDIRVPEFTEPLPVLCNDDWLVILLRSNGAVNFYRSWQEYKTGFGIRDTEFFFGLEKLHILTKAKRYELKIRLKDFDNDERTAIYDRFEIGSEAEAYSLKALGSYSGTAGDSLSIHRGKKFSTYDRDNDLNHFGSCAELSAGAWWYADDPCHESNLFGHYSAIPMQRNGRGIVWNSFHGPDYSLMEVIMMIRPSKKCR